MPYKIKFLKMPIFFSGHYVPPPSDSTIGSNMSEILDRTHLGSSEANMVNNGATPPGMPKPVSNWSRSYQNPVGTIYYPPSEADARWVHRKFVKLRNLEVNFGI